MVRVRGLRPSRRSAQAGRRRPVRLHLEALESRTVPTVYTPAQVAHAYGFDQINFGGVTGDGTGQTIAIVDAYNNPSIDSSLANFDRQWGLPDPVFTKVDQNGGTNYPANNSGWGLEIALDVEWAHAMAPGANILLVEATNNSYANLFTAVNYAANSGASAVSLSWGSGEFFGETSFDATFAAASGVSFLVSSGDNGAPGGYPAYSPYVVAVGGTRLTADSQGNYISETGWSGSGGGISTQEGQPAYQQGTVTQSSTQRTIPDVAYNADPGTGVYVYDSYNGGWYSVGGTSAGAPQWAALVAIANQGRNLNGLPPLGSSPSQGSQEVLTDLYNLQGDLTDITTGYNGFFAGPGYDLVTGIGTPQANVLAVDLANASTPPGGAGPASAHGPGDRPATALPSQAGPDRGAQRAHPASLVSEQVPPPPTPGPEQPVHAALSTTTAFVQPAAVRAPDAQPAPTAVALAVALAPTRVGTAAGGSDPAAATPAMLTVVAPSALLPVRYLPAAPAEARPASGGADRPAEDDALRGAPGTPAIPAGEQPDATDATASPAVAALPAAAVSDAYFLGGAGVAAATGFDGGEAVAALEPGPTLDTVCLGLALAFVGGGYLAAPATVPDLPELRRPRPTLG
jgi:hypothetical protein